MKSEGREAQVEVDRPTVPGVYAPPVRWTDVDGSRWSVTVTWQTDPELKPVGVTVTAYDEDEAGSDDGSERRLSGPVAPGEQGHSPALAAVTRGLFARLPMAQMIDRSRARLFTSELRFLAFDEDELTPVVTARGADLLEAHRAARRSRSAARNSDGDRTALLEQVADLYRVAFAEQPQRAAARTAELLAESGNYAAGQDGGRVRVRKWIGDARRAGLIPKTTARRAGWDNRPRSEPS